MHDFVEEIARAVIDQAIPSLLDRVLPKVIAEVKNTLDADTRTAAGAVYVKVQTAAEMISAHPSTVRKLVAEGKLGKFTVEGQLRVKVSDIHAYLARDGGPTSPTVDLNERALAILRDKPRNNDD
jgi:excisionase family DNA binding protein